MTLKSKSSKIISSKVSLKAPSKVSSKNETPSSNQSLKDSLIVPLGKVVRQHGIPKGDFCKWKVDLFVPGGEAFQNAQSLYFFHGPSDGRLHARSISELGAQKVILTKPCEALGAKWGSTPAVLIPLESPNFDPLKMSVGILRSDFPQTDSFYICDLLGREFLDSKNTKTESYIVDGVFNASQVSGIESWILRLISVSSKKAYEVPLQPLINQPETYEQIRGSDFSRPISVNALGDWLQAFIDNGETADDQ